MIEAVGFKKHVFAGKAQVSPLHKVILVTGFFRISPRQIFCGKKLETEAEALPSNGANSGMPHCEATMPAIV